MGGGQVNDEGGRMTDELSFSAFTGDNVSSSFINRHRDLSPVVPPIILDLTPTDRRWPSIGPFSVGSVAFPYVVAAIIVGVGLLVGGAWRVSRLEQRDDVTRWQLSTDRTATIPTVGRITGMVDCQWTDPAAAPADREPVPLGRKYALAGGLLEITYDIGARVILEGPVTYEIESANGGLLSFGKLTAPRGTRQGDRETRRQGGERARRCFPVSASPCLPVSPSPCLVFRPHSYGRRHGSRYGVRRRGQPFRRQPAHVFRGRVEFRPIGGAHSTAANSLSVGEDSGQPVQLTENESASVGVGGDRSVTVIREAGEPNAFARRIPQRTPITLFNTGLGLKEGGPDPHWQLVAVSNQPKFRPRLATVSRLPFRIWLANDSTRSQWISTGDGMPDLPHGVTYTFRTTFELGDAMPDTAVLQGWFIVDNYIRAIRLNGTEVPVPAHSDGSNGLFHQFYRFVARRGFVAGTNVLEMDVYNGHRGLPPDGRASAMGLRVELEGSVRGEATAPPGESSRTEKRNVGRGDKK